MKRKLTILLFSLLIAVGWTSSVFAQSSYDEAYRPFTANEAKAWTYSWTDAGGTTHNNVDPTLKVTDAYQMYYLLRHVYMDKRFPGPFQSAYKADGTTRERDVYYGGMDSGWDIPGIAINNGDVTTSAVGNITITMTNGNYSFQSIVVKSGNTVLTQWSYASNGTNLPTNWSSTKAFTAENNTSCFMSQGGTITINASLLQDATNVTVEIYGRHDPGYSDDVTVTVSGSTGSSSSQTFTQANDATWKTSTWTVNGNTTGGSTGIGDITIYCSSSAARIKSITVTSGNTTLFSWSMANDFINRPPGFSVGTIHYYGNTAIYALEDDPITLQGWLFEGYSNVTVTINGYYYQTSGSTFTVNGNTLNITANSSSSSANYSTTINSKTFVGPTMYQADQYKPNKEGYTALVVKLRNNIYHAPDAAGFGHHQSFYNSKDSIISYLSRNVESIQLLTDGLVIGSDDQIGTVFNAPVDEYNKFFFLSKGQARQKTNPVLQQQVYKQHLLGEQVPFAQMFEQFSPTGGKDGDQIFDFYSEMMQGKVYRIVHDCLSVIQNEHEFSMSGNTDTTRYEMSGMNFFIPDHRLQYWELTDTVTAYRWNGSASEKYVKEIYTVDGRDMNTYQPASANKSDDHSTFYTTPSQVAVWYAQYDTAQHAPLVGLYLIELEAEASQCEGYSEDNRFYQSTLDWTSSLNEMSGNGVSQTYIIYEVRTDSVTGEKYNYPIDTLENCTDFHPQLTLDTLYEQHAHSYTVTYVIMGSPTDSDHPGFVAWSNRATVIIPGYDDFMVLNLHHYESDFHVNYTVPQGANYYRNYLQPENDFVNGITRESILGGYDSFILYRTSTDGKVPVAKLKFAVDSQNKVRYKITYFEENQDTDWRNNIDIDAVIQQLINKSNN